MNQEVKKLWVDALRSGEYKQGKNKLKTDNDEYCCLGVLCDIYRKVVGGKWKETEFITPTGSNVGVPPSCVVKWAELPDHNPYLDGHPASDWNDHRNANFNKIADLVEKEL